MARGSGASAVILVSWAGRSFLDRQSRDLIVEGVRLTFMLGGGSAPTFSPRTSGEGGDVTEDSSIALRNSLSDIATGSPMSSSSWFAQRFGDLPVGDIGCLVGRAEGLSGAAASFRSRFRDSAPGDGGNPAKIFLTFSSMI